MRKLSGQNQAIFFHWQFFRKASSQSMNIKRSSQTEVAVYSCDVRDQCVLYRIHLALIFYQSQTPCGFVFFTKIAWDKNVILSEVKKSLVWIFGKKPWECAGYPNHTFSPLNTLRKYLLRNRHVYPPWKKPGTFSTKIKKIKDLFTTMQDTIYLLNPSCINWASSDPDTQ